MQDWVNLFQNDSERFSKLMQEEKEFRSFVQSKYGKINPLECSKEELDQWHTNYFWERDKRDLKKKITNPNSLEDIYDLIDRPFFKHLSEEEKAGIKGMRELISRHNNSNENIIFTNYITKEPISLEQCFERNIKLKEEVYAELRAEGFGLEVEKYLKKIKS